MSCKNQYKNAVRLTLEQIDVIRRLSDTYPNDFVFVTEAEGIRNALKAGKIGCMIGVEGGHSIDSSLDTLRMMYDMGARYMTLTHSCHTPWYVCVCFVIMWFVCGLCVCGLCVVCVCVVCVCVVCVCVYVYVCMYVCM